MSAAPQDNNGRRHNTMLDSDLRGRVTMMQMQITNTPKQKSRTSLMGKGRHTIFGKAHLWRHSTVISKEEQPEIPYGNGLDEEVISYITTKLQSCFLFLSLSDTQMIDLATRFEVKEYEIGEHIIMQGSRTDCSRTTVDGTDIYFYLLAEGECKCIKDGKQVHGQYGVIDSPSVGMPWYLTMITKQLCGVLIL